MNRRLGQAHLNSNHELREARDDQAVGGAKWFVQKKGMATRPECLYMYSSEVIGTSSYCGSTLLTQWWCKTCLLTERLQETQNLSQGDICVLTRLKVFVDTACCRQVFTHRPRRHSHVYFVFHRASLVYRQPLANTSNYLSCFLNTSSKLECRSRLVACQTSPTPSEEASTFVA